MDQNIYSQVISMVRIIHDNPVFLLFNSYGDILINNQNYFHAIRRTTENSIFTFLTEKQEIQLKNLIGKVTAAHPVYFTINGKKVKLYGFDFVSPILLLCSIMPDAALTKSEQETYKHLIKGLNYDIIAEKTCHSTSSIKKQAKDIYNKFSPRLISYSILIVFLK